MTTEPVRVVFMGSARFAVPSLEGMTKSGYKLVAVVSQPARPAGRGRKVTPSPVTEAAERLGLRVLTPEKLRSPESVAQLSDLRPDLIVVAAYAQILPRAVLDLPRFGCLNVHASLLPRWRGASPMQAAILAGDEFTGVSIMLMEPTMDTGPVLGKVLTRIEDSDTLPDLEDRLATSGAALLGSVIPCYIGGSAVPVIQEEVEATYAPLIHKQAGLIDWTFPARQIWLASRAYRPWPGSYSYWNGQMLKVLACSPDDSPASSAQPGTVLALSGGRGAGVVTGDQVLRLEEVALEGGRPMPIQQFLAGHRSLIGAKLGGHESSE